MEIYSLGMKLQPVGIHQHGNDIRASATPFQRPNFPSYLGRLPFATLRSVFRPSLHYRIATSVEFNCTAKPNGLPRMTFPSESSNSIGTLNTPSHKYCLASTLILCGTIFRANNGLKDLWTSTPLKYGICLKTGLFQSRCVLFVTVASP